MVEESSLGAKLRILRKERSLTQRELAGRAKISVNAISLIERNEISPSVSTLRSLAGALNIKMGYFFDDGDTHTKVVHIVANQRPSIAGNGITIGSIGQRLPEQQIEPFFITIGPYSKSDKQRVVHTGHEFVYCLHGAVEYEVDGKVYLLKQGDILLFEATLPHHWRNPTTEQAEMLVVLQTSDEPSEPVRRHFPSYPSLTHIT